MYRWTNNSPVSPLVLALRRTDHDELMVSGTVLSGALRSSTTGDQVRNLYPEELCLVPQHSC